ncbi:MAG: hypothetical protein RR635_06575 [Oscillospiraceae bacterium]
MKKYFLKTTVFILALCIPLAMFFFYIQGLPQIYSESIMGTIHYKTELIKSTRQSPRVILVGGSSSPYGTICEEFQKAFNMPCINIGATAYFGIDYYISILNQYTQEGDVVVFAPEHISMRDKNIDYTTLWLGLGNDKQCLELLPISYYPGMAFSFIEYSKYKIELKDAPAPIYEHHKDFGPLGDVTAVRTTLLESGYNKDDIVTLSKDILYSGSINSLNRYYKKAIKKGVNVYFAFAPLDKLAVTSNDEDIASYDAAIKKQLKIPVIGSVQDHIMEGEYFYDTNNHLTSEGAKVNTDMLIKELSSVWQKPQN